MINTQNKKEPNLKRKNCGTVEGRKESTAKTVKQAQVDQQHDISHCVFWVKHLLALSLDRSCCW